MHILNHFDNAPNIWDLTVNSDDLPMADCTTIVSIFGSLDETYRYHYFESMLPRYAVLMNLQNNSQ